MSVRSVRITPGRSRHFYALLGYLMFFLTSASLYASWGSLSGGYGPDGYFAGTVFLAFGLVCAGVTQLCVWKWRRLSASRPEVQS